MWVVCIHDDDVVEGVGGGLTLVLGCTRCGYCVYTRTRLYNAFGSGCTPGRLGCTRCV